MFIFRFLCWFTFCQHKQLPMVAQFFKGYASLEITRPREVATDLTFLTGLVKGLLRVMGCFFLQHGIGGPVNAGKEES
jgi:hypothetical protein